MSEEPIPALIERLIRETRAHHPERPALIGVGGAQGSGKSHWCARVIAEDSNVAHFSLDDVYRTRGEREIRVSVRALPETMPEHQWEKFFPGCSRDEYNRDKAASAHLFLTRGPPGTHDLPLATALIARLRLPVTTPLPRFNKKTDDRMHEDTWPLFQGPAEAILIDGWCVGALSAPDGPALNGVEREDVLGEWRRSIGSALQREYAPFFAAFDAIIYLQAPSFEIVRRWRGEQEEKTLGRPLTAEEDAALDRFVQHYERITRAMLAGHLRADWIVGLDENRTVTGIERR